MKKKLSPLPASIDELEKAKGNEIITGQPCENGSEVEVQSITIDCPSCKRKYWNAMEFRYTICPHCGFAVKWW